MHAPDICYEITLKPVQSFICLFHLYRFDTIYFILQARWTSLKISVYVKTVYYELPHQSRSGHTFTTYQPFCK
jgi:hypothetical protein